MVVPDAELLERHWSSGPAAPLQAEHLHSWQLHHTPSILLDAEPVTGQEQGYLGSDRAVALQAGDFGGLVSRQQLHGAHLYPAQTQGVHRVCIQRGCLHSSRTISLTAATQALGDLG